MLKIPIMIGAISLTFCLSACTPPEPVKIGLIGGLSDRGSDFGESVQGVILAVEQQKQSGWHNGRKIELIVRDDGQDSDCSKISTRTD